jgi:hypothetical protein
VVDPIRGKKEQIFDNDKIAAELTRISLDPWDAQHLPIEKIKFIDQNTLQFEVKSSQDEEEKKEEEDLLEEEDQKEEKDQEEKKKPKKITFHFEYKIKTQTLRELKDWEAPDEHPKWANVSPDGKTIVFARNHNLYMMNSEDYKKILDAGRGKDEKQAEKAIEKVLVNEIQLTHDGEKHFGYAVFERGDTDDEREKNKDKRNRPEFIGLKIPKSLPLFAVTGERAKNYG